MTVHRELYAPAGAGVRYLHVATLAGRGDGPQRFRKALRGVAVGSDGRVVTVGDGVVKVFRPGGELRAAWETERTPLSVAVDGAGNVLVGELAQVEVFDARGARRSVLRDPERLGRVTALAPLADGWLVADASHRRLRRYSSEGEHLADIGHDNRMQGFLIPNGYLDFALDEQGVLHAANPGKHRVERYSLGGELLGHIGRFDGRDPEGFAGCCNPTNVALAGRERIYVTEKAAPRVKAYDHEGRLVAVIASEVFDPGCKNMDLAVDARGRVYVTDTVRLEVLVFEPIDGQEQDGR